MHRAVVTGHTDEGSVLIEVNAADKADEAQVSVLCGHRSESLPQLPHSNTPVVRTVILPESKPGHSPSSGANSRPPCYPRGPEATPTSCPGEKNSPPMIWPPRWGGVTWTGWVGPRADRWESRLHDRPHGRYLQILATFLSLKPRCSSTHLQKPQTQGLRSCSSRAAAPQSYRHCGTRKQPPRRGQVGLTGG